MGFNVSCCRAHDFVPFDTLFSWKSFSLLVNILVRLSLTFKDEDVIQFENAEHALNVSLKIAFFCQLMMVKISCQLMWKM
jgi:hypothetical protein